jgi:hypothetical protein
MQRIFNLMAFASFVVTGTFVGILFFSIYQLDRLEKEAVERLGAGVKADIQKQLDEKLKLPVNGTPGASLY